MSAGVLTIRGEFEARSIGGVALVTRLTPITLVSTTARTVAGPTVVGDQAGRRGHARVVGQSSGTPNASTPLARSPSTAA
ncbi:hypothetical protein ASE16_02165 [Leifsonia sp. Root227]|nr:hypothetical protein ASE16_02165 [Leifsonia sp. Root227]